MQEDFHYYATYCASFIAGYSHEESLDIAYSAQFVDVCSRTLLAKIKGPSNAATTQLQLELMDARTDPVGLQDITRIWSSFHFLPRDLMADKKKKILVIRLGAIGDVVHTTIIPKAIKLKHPDYEIHYLTQNEIAPILDNNPYIDKVIPMITKKKKDNKYLIELGMELFKERYDTVFCLTNALRTLLFATMCLPKRIVLKHEGKGLSSVLLRLIQGVICTFINRLGTLPGFDPNAPNGTGNGASSLKNDGADRILNLLYPFHRIRSADKHSELISADPSHGSCSFFKAI